MTISTSVATCHAKEKVLTFNIDGLQHSWSSTERGAQQKTLALGSMSEEAAERKPRFLAGVTADMSPRPHRDILGPKLPTGYLEGQESRCVPSHTLLEEKSLLTFMKQSLSRPTVGSAFTLCGSYCAGVYGARKCKKTPKWPASNWAGEEFFHSDSKVHAHVHPSGALYRPLSVGGCYKTQFNIRN